MGISTMDFAASLPHRPAGWYPDPIRPARMRWWDGEEWTAETGGARTPIHTAAAAFPPTPVAPPATIASPAPRRRHPLLTGAAAAVLTVTVVGGAAYWLAHLGIAL
ncbi:DUF2510 domain-containing protein [Demequina capsici]|uniref:DUF2510 domain-containing protein n=1 Tax=Demequina capsici TaxID=3075620 RepID=A0AA96FC92_9MICO|nr:MULTISPECIES: DUF2510 domain-containing protein [unclassified Demequina]WNM24220.1 DUF2510 domain-containing protein [Demequina sp. OYTSA14]WNM27049.1 DUF2510 domain-containing protein [Demequina sp. PMTSA13]